MNHSLQVHISPHVQNMEYKFVELLSTQFFASDEDVVRTQVRRVVTCSLRGWASNYI